jgi:hypothetical protein
MYQLKVLLFDAIHPDDLPDLYAQCDVGIVSLDPRHKSHSIPGKFLTYMQSGLSVLISPLIKLTLAVIDTAKVSGSFTPTD